MKGRTLILLGAIAGVVIGNTPQGRRAYKEAGRRVARFWRDPRVQARVDDLQEGVAKVPGVGPDLAGFIDSTRPEARASKPGAAMSDDGS